jgi:hypothetical protein
MKKFRQIILTEQQQSFSQWKATLVFTLLTLFIPFLAHLLPHQGATPVGAIWLPMFYMPFMAVVLFRVHVGILAGLLAPLVNFLVTGLPEPRFLMVLSLELTLFALLVSLGSKSVRKIPLWLLAPLGYVLAKLCSSAVLLAWPHLLGAPIAPQQFFLQSVGTAWPGLCALALLGLLTDRFSEWLRR